MLIEPKVWLAQYIRQENKQFWFTVQHRLTRKSHGNLASWLRSGPISATLLMWMRSAGPSYVSVCFFVLHSVAGWWLRRSGWRYGRKEIESPQWLSRLWFRRGRPHRGSLRKGKSIRGKPPLCIPGRRNLDGADLEGANLIRAKIFGVNLKGAGLKEANLTVTILKNANIEGAKFCKTKTPWGLDNSGCEK